VPLLKDLAKRFLSEIRLFSKFVLKRPLHNYQLEVATAIVASVLRRLSLEFVVIFPRQSGKNETQSHIEAYLLTLFQRIAGASIVKAQPTFKPQAINSIERIERQLKNDWTRALWKRAQGYIVKVGEAAIYFFSAEPSANVVGATASILLECDEAQDVLESEWGKKFEPMTASTAATIAYWGTVWTSTTMLAKNRKRLEALEKQDGIRRVFIVSPEQVVAENPAYQKFIDRMIAKYGRQHPFVKTQVFNEEIDAQGGMFPPARRALVEGTHARLDRPRPGQIYAATLDVAGEDEAAQSTAIGELDPEQLANPKRDSTILRIVEVDLSTKHDPIINAPTYRTVRLYSWIGIKHTRIYAQVRGLVTFWNCAFVIGDETGVGHGLTGFLATAFPNRVIPFTFTSQSKSQLGWDAIALVETRRVQMYADEDAHRATYLNQLEHCQHEILPGPGRLMRWGVPDNFRDPATGEIVHDDYIITDAMCSLLDEQEWFVSTGPTHVIQGTDPLDDMKGF
jgi:hypothetical protein